MRACDAEPYRLSVYVYEITMRLLIARQFVQMYWLLSFSLAEIAWAEAWFGTVVVCTLFRSYDYVQYLTMFMFESYIFDEIITKFLSVCLYRLSLCLHLICLLFSLNILQRLVHFIFTLRVNPSANVCGARRKKNGAFVSKTNWVDIFLSDSECCFLNRHSMPSVVMK